MARTILLIALAWHVRGQEAETHDDGRNSMMRREKANDAGLQSSSRREAMLDEKANVQNFVSCGDGPCDDIQEPASLAEGGEEGEVDVSAHSIDKEDATELKEPQHLSNRAEQQMATVKKHDDLHAEGALVPDEFVEDKIPSALEIDNSVSTRETTPEEYELISLLDSGGPLFQQLGKASGTSAVSFKNVMESIHQTRQTDKDRQMESLEKVAELLQLKENRNDAPSVLLEAEPQTAESKRFASATPEARRLASVLMRIIDQDGDNRISQWEFDNVPTFRNFDMLMHTYGFGTIPSDFAALDRNEHGLDGYASLADFSDACDKLLAVDRTVAKDQDRKIQTMLMVSDTNKDKMVDMKELVAFLHRDAHPAARAAWEELAYAFSSISDGLRLSKASN